MYLGPRPVVTLCGIEAIREALVDQAEAFSGRGKIAIVEPVFQGYGKGREGTWRGRMEKGIGEDESGKRG